MDAHRIKKTVSRAPAQLDLRLSGTPVTPVELGRMLSASGGLSVVSQSILALFRRVVRTMLRRLQGKPFKVAIAGRYHLENGQLRREQVPISMLLNGASQRAGGFWMAKSILPGAASRHAVCFSPLDAKDIEPLSQAGYCVTLIGGCSKECEAVADGHLIPENDSPAPVLVSAVIASLPLLKKTSEILFVFDQYRASLSGSDLIQEACQNFLAASLNGANEGAAEDLESFLSKLTRYKQNVVPSSQIARKNRVAFEAQVCAQGPLNDQETPALYDYTKPLAALKVSFFGPWNFDSGLALASRSYARALLRTGALVNIDPVRASFGPHEPLAAATGIRNFVGPPDVAIVNLNPDGWHNFLDDTQLSQICSSRFRIGAFIWEGQRLPEAFRQVACYLDEIWAPTKFVQQCFKSNMAGSISIVPYEVSTVFPTLSATRLQQVREDLGLEKTDRLVLYVFDAASFLLRKNPEALLKAFIRSGLVDDGWKLVLKTKHIRSGDPDGNALRAAAANCPGCLLLDNSLPELEYHALCQLADIYASPHASEGFGLTIAEALQRGKPVVATDFGGSQDFLSPETGFPVHADPFCLVESIGPYARGTIWKAVDIQALSIALRHAASLSPSARMEMAHRAQSRISENYGMNTVVESMQRRLLSYAQAVEGSDPDV